MLKPNGHLTPTEFDMAAPFARHCGSPDCLGIIRGFTYLSTDERERLQPMLALHLRRLPSPCAGLVSR